MSDTEREREDTQDDLLSAYFEKSATAVRRSFGRFEKDLARPTVRYVLASFKYHPIRSTFLTTYAALGALPLLSFLGFSIFVFSSSVFFALCAALLAASSIVLFLGFWLACTMAFLGLIAIPLTIGILGAYLLLRLAFLARREGSARAALSQWAQETKGSFVKRQLEEHHEPGVQTSPEAVTLVVGSIALDSTTESTGLEEKEEIDAQSDGFSTVETMKVEGSP